MPTVSVITPAYRAANTLPRAVRSVLDQRFDDWEMLIVGDDGRDYRRLLDAVGLADDPRLRFFDSGGVARGPGAARNVALEAARGRFIAPLDADDLFYPDRLERLLPLARTHGIAGDNTRVVDDTTGDPLRDAFAAGGEDFELDPELYTHISVPMIFVFDRRHIPRGWDADVRFGEDTLFNLRLMEHLPRVPIIGDPLHEYRVMSTSLCHAGDAHQRAETTYRRCLMRLQEDGLGFRTAEARNRVEQMLKHKRETNHLYARKRANGFRGPFQHFLNDIDQHYLHD